MSDEAKVQYKFLIPVDLKRRLEDAAHSNRRSVSAEVIARLEASLGDPIDGLDVEEMMTRADLTRMLAQQEAVIADIKRLNSRLSEIEYRRHTDLVERMTENDEDAEKKQKP